MVAVQPTSPSAATAMLEINSIEAGRVGIERAWFRGRDT
jgi:hypothetical protein